nr:unnamed protein product [Spirometra erinaceieuropaei]
MPEPNPRSSDKEADSKEKPVGAEDSAGRYKMDIAALCETHFSKQKHLEEVDAGHTFFRGGHMRTGRLGLQDQTSPMSFVSVCEMSQPVLHVGN